MKSWPLNSFVAGALFVQFHNTGSAWSLVLGITNLLFALASVRR